MGLRPLVAWTPPAPLLLEEVEFLVHKDINLINELYHRQELFQSFLAKVIRYSETRAEAARVTAMSTAGGVPPAGFTAALLEALVGPTLHFEMTVLLQSFYEGYPDLRAKLLETFNKVNEHVLARYRDKPLGLAFEEPPVKPSEERSTT